MDIVDPVREEDLEVILVAELDGEFQWVGPDFGERFKVVSYAAGDRFGLVRDVLAVRLADLRPVGEHRRRAGAVEDRVNLGVEHRLQPHRQEALGCVGARWENVTAVVVDNDMPPAPFHLLALCCQLRAFRGFGTGVIRDRQNSESGKERKQQDFKPHTMLPSSAYL